MKKCCRVKFLALSSLISITFCTLSVSSSDDIVFVSDDQVNPPDSKSSHHLVTVQSSQSPIMHSHDQWRSNVEVRKRYAFLLTGIIVYQTTRVLGHASIWAAAGLSIAGGFAVGGPAGAGAAYLNVVATIGPASAAIETASLAIGTAASWIPGLP